MSEIMKSKTTLIREWRERLFSNIYKLEELGYTQEQIWTIVWDYKQVISSIKNNENYPLSIKKSKSFNEKIEEFLKKLDS